MSSTGSHLDAADEEYESVPWDALLNEPRPDRKRWVSVAVVGVVLAVVAASAARTLWPTSPAPVALPASDEAPEPGPARVPPSASEPVAENPGEISEADLMAIDGDDAVLAAAGQAASFAAAFFTLDGSDRSSVLARLPDGVVVPEPDPAARSFVESADPVAVTRLSPSRFAVTVIVRSLSAVGDDGYARDPDRAVEVTLDLGPDGAALVDLPAPVPVPVTVSAGWDTTPSEPPPAVREAATAQAATWGTGEVLGAGKVGEVWRIVVEARSASGVSWPLAVWLDDTGNPVPPGG